VWMLPTIVIVRDGTVVNRIEGFEALGSNDDFTTKQLEKLLVQLGAFSRSKNGKENDDDDE